MNNRRIKPTNELVFFGYDEYNNVILIELIISSKTIRIKLNLKRISLCVVLCKNPLEKHHLMNKIKDIVYNKKTQKLNTHNEYTSYYYRNFPVCLIYDNVNYFITVDINNSIYKSEILDINKLLTILKKELLQPGDKFIGLEAINPLSFEKGKLIWKAKCLLCGRTVKIREDHLKENKSCGCINNKHFDTDKERFYSKVDKQESVPKEQQIRGTLGIDEEPCWLWTGYRPGFGYGTFSINDKPRLAHRYSWEIHNNKELNNSKVFICHRCDNPVCVNPNHLFKGDIYINIQDKVDKNRHAHGESHGMKKLNNNTVLKIRNSYESCMKLSKKFDVSDSAIRSIRSKKSWKHLK